MNLELAPALGRLSIVALMAAIAAPPARAQDCLDSGLNDDPPPLPTFDPVQDGDDLQNAIDAGVLWPSPFVVAVEPGTYDPITIFADAFPNGLLVYSTGGAYDLDTGLPRTTIQGTGTGPVIEIIGSFFESPLIRIGWAVDAHPADWQGFRITGGFVFDPTTGGAGIRATVHTGSLQVRGCYVEENESSQIAGGVYLRDCVDVLFAYNEIRHNRTAVLGLYVPIPVRGAGLYQVRGNLLLIANQIHHNTFGTVVIGYPLEPARQGGGVASSMVSFLSSSVTLCTNVIHDNDASEGGGVWIDQVAHSSVGEAHLEANRVHDNLPWAPKVFPPGQLIDGGFRGGGIFVRGESTDIKGPGVARVRLYNNRVRDNVAENPGFVATAVDDVGGGAYVEYIIRKNDEVELEGNALWRNETPLAGGGAFLDWSDVGPGQILQNTLAWNVLEPGGLGGGLYLTSSTVFDGSSNVMFNNTVPGSTGNAVDWFAEFGVLDDMRFSQMPSYSGAGSDIFGPGTNENDFADPLLFPQDPHLTGEPLMPSPCINSGEPTLPEDIVVDIDNNPRSIDWPGAPGVGTDRGADEFVAFKRGNANADFSLDISDALFILNYLFAGGPAPVCPDAADVNDDGNLDISDPIMLLNYLFPSMGGPPIVIPEPFTICSADPTLDTLETGIGTPWF